MKEFLKIVKYEFIRLTRNKLVLGLLLFFSIILLFILSFSSVKDNNYKIALYKDGLSQEVVDEFISTYPTFNSNNLIEVDNKEAGIKLVNKAKAQLFVCLNASTSPATAVVFYDGSSYVGKSIKGNLTDKKNEYAYKHIKEFLSEYGIEINEASFETLTFESTTRDKITSKQLPFMLEIACCVSIIIMFGLAYSIARDNETKVSKNLNFMPIGVNKYLFSKAIPYFLLGTFEIILLYGMGAIFFDIHYRVNFFVLLLFSLLFILATVMLGIVFSLFKNQISTVLFDMLTILLPIFIISSSFIKNFPFILQMLFYAFPITAFSSLGSPLIFNNVLLWEYVGMLICQIVVYYLIAFMLVKHRKNA